MTMYSPTMCGYNRQWIFSRMPQVEAYPYVLERRKIHNATTQKRNPSLSGASGLLSRSRVIFQCMNVGSEYLGKRFIAGQSTQTAKGLSKGGKAVMILTGVGSLGYFLLHSNTLSKEPVQPHAISLYRQMPFKTMSRLMGRFNQVDLPVYLRKPLIGLYVWLFGCDVQEAMETDLRYYRNLGEFFRRQLREGARPVDDAHMLTSPADGRVLYHGLVKNGILEQVKGVTYSLRGFLGPPTWDTSSSVDPTEAGVSGVDSQLTPDEAYQASMPLRPGNQLYHCIIYLAPGDYHRFHSPATWTVEHRRHFPGELLSVNPGVARWIQGLFNLNERANYTGTWEHGYFCMSAVGATNVGSIKIYSDEELVTNVHSKQPEHVFFDKKFDKPVTVEKGDMFGEFNLGSTIVLIFEAPKGFKFKAGEGDKVNYGRPLGCTSLSTSVSSPAFFS